MKGGAYSLTGTKSPQLGHGGANSTSEAADGVLPRANWSDVSPLSGDWNSEDESCRVSFLIYEKGLLQG